MRQTARMLRLHGKQLSSGQPGVARVSAAQEQAGLPQKAEVQSTLGWPPSRMLCQLADVDLVPLWTPQASVPLRLHRAICGISQQTKSGLCRYALQLQTPDTFSTMHIVEAAPMCAVSAFCPVMVLPEARP